MRYTCRLMFFLIVLVGLSPAITVASVPSSAPQIQNTALGILSAATPTAENGYAHPDWLVDAVWLQAHLEDPSVRVIALTDPDTFQKGHIPGSAHIDWTDLELADSSDTSIASWQTQMEHLLTELGIAPSNTVVIYDGGTLYAPRLWWILDDLGHQDKRILNGGFAAWMQSGGQTEQGESTITPAKTPYLATPSKTALATLHDVSQNLTNPAVVLVDARSAAEYAQGHIPGAINIPFTDNAAPDQPRFWKSAEQLQAMYLAAGASPDKTIIPYCSTGVRSAATYFALRLIGYPNVSLFSGSWAEWNQHPDLPKTTGSAP